MTSFPDSLEAPELVTHLFFAAERSRTAGQDYGELVALWHRCADRLGLNCGIADFPTNPNLDSVPLGSGLVATRQNDRPDIRQAMLRKEHDLYILSVIGARAAGGGRQGWAELSAEMNGALGSINLSSSVGSVTIFQARIAAAATQVDEPSLRRDVSDALEEVNAAIRIGAVVETSNLGRFAVWEAVDRLRIEDAWDMRQHRTVVVVAAANHDQELSAWTWNRGDAELTPFGRYLSHAAKVRHQLRLAEPGRHGKEFRHKVDASIGPLLRLVNHAAETRRDPDFGRLLRASAPLVMLQASELGLIDRASRIREIHRTITIAGRNMNRNAAHDVGLFADDQRLVEFLTQQLENDLAYLEAVLDRARSVSAFSDQLLQRGLQRRQERFNLGLTGVLGAVIMVLTAVQALEYKPSLPTPAVPGVISVLGALALLVSLIVVRTAVATPRIWPSLLICAAAVLLGAATGWTLAELSVNENASQTLHGWTLAVGGGILGGIVGAVVTVRRQRVHTRP